MHIRRSHNSSGRPDWADQDPSAFLYPFFEPAPPGSSGASAKAHGKTHPAADISSPAPSGPAPATSSTAFRAVITQAPSLEPPTGAGTVLPTDTLFAKQWTLASTAGGINVAGAWQNYTGEGIKIGIVDDGIDYTHPDLAPNYLTGLQYDAVTPDGSAMGTADDAHGTTVAGVLAGARNGLGVVGVAYGAGIAGFRIGYGNSGNAAQYAAALNQLARNGMDVANASWGYSVPFQDNFNTYWSSSKAAILNDVQSGRHGLGIPIVFAAMNNRAAGDNVNYHNYQNDPYVITVAATNSIGKLASFSNPGAALLVAAPGTAQITDDRVGAAGWSKTGYVSVQGTSYSAPAVTGVIALMLEANPALGFRDVETILAYSARQNDPTNAGWATNGATNWNGGGLHFNNNYGFGLVDATAAVRLAESWRLQSTYADMSSETAAQAAKVALTGGKVVSSQITLDSSLLMQKAVVDLNLSDQNVSGLVVSLTSPSGTVAVLASHPKNGTGSGIQFEMSANNFWGEDANGTWTLTVRDTLAGNTGTLNNWSLTTLGDSPTTPVDYIYTDAFATAVGQQRSVLTDDTGLARINTAAVTTGSYLDLHAGATDQIAGRDLQIGADTIVRNLWAGDGNDTIVANDAGDTIQAGRGNDTIIAGLGGDTLSGGPGNDTFVFNAQPLSPDVITDFLPGSDMIDLRGLISSSGYSGSDPVADGWLSLQPDGHGGTAFAVGRAANPAVDVASVAPSMLHQGSDYLTVTGVA